MKRNSFLAIIFSFIGNTMMAQCPNPFTVSGGGTVCGGAGVTIQLSSSTSGVNYQLKNGGVNSGSVVVGTGAALTWTNQTTAGTYTVVGIITSSGCTTNMTGNASISVPAMAQLYTMTWSGGTLCGGFNTIGLTGSQSGITYTLIWSGGTPTNATKSGTGNALSWTNSGNFSSGTYTIQANSGGCHTAMNGNVVAPKIPTVYTVSGGGTVCSAGVPITLSSSQTSFNYQLLINGVSSGSPVQGTGSSIELAEPITAGTYTVAAIDPISGCSVNMTGSKTVTVSTPQTFSVSGAGSFCTSPSVTIAMNGSQTGTTYSLLRGSTTLQTLSGTGSALTWPTQTTGGTYTVQATSGSCTSTMNGNVVIGSPSAFSVSGGGTVCTTGATINLSSSQTNVNYQLKINGTNSGSITVGTGSSLSWPGQLTGGTYTIVGTMTNGCSTTMTGSATVTAHTPQPFNITSSGDLCGGGAIISLSGSQTGASYTLLRGGTTVQTTSGTGNALNFSSQSVTGTYTIQATVSGCMATMNGSIIIGTPATNYTVSGGGSVCSTAGVSVNLSSSQTGVNYQLLVNGTSSGDPIAGTGSSIGWSNQLTAGTYTVVGSLSSNNCTTSMGGSANVTVQPVFTVGGGGTFCGTSSGFPITLSGSKSGVNYQLQRAGQNIGQAITGTGSALTWPLRTTNGTYTVTTTGSCIQQMTDSAVILVGQPPANSYTLSGGGYVCTGGTGFTLTLSGSQMGINYQLQNNGVNIGTAFGGTGASMTWTNITATGSYTVIATDPSSSVSCPLLMAGSALITSNPVQFTVQLSGNYCSGSSGVTVSLSGSERGVSYQLNINGTNSGAALVGAGSSLSWPNQSTIGTYTIYAVQAGNSTCSQIMTGSANIVSNPLPTTFSVGGGGTYCPGAGGVSISLSGSQAGATYKLLFNGTDIKVALPGTGSSLTWPSQSNIGTYTVTAINSSTECAAPMSGSASVALKPVPATFTLGGGTILASTSQSTTIVLSGSESGVSYQLQQNGQVSGVAISGTGAAINWPGINNEGEYSVVATNSSTSCSSVMSGTPDVLIALTNNTGILSNYAFQYKYDGRRRQVQKRVPGSDWVYMVYDYRDRLVMTQDGNQRPNKQWTFTKYDALNRPVMTGIYTHDAIVDQVTMQGVVDNYYNNLSSLQAWYESYSTVAGNIHNYDNKSFPQFTAPTVTDPNAYLTVTYYDDNTSIENLWGTNGTNYHYSNDHLTSGSYLQSDFDFRNVVGHPVAGKLKLLDGSNTWLKSAMFYDDHYRVIQTIADNNKGGYDRTSSLYDFVGKTLATKTTHHTSTHTDQTVARNFTYDHVGRLTQTWHSVGGVTPILLSQNNYNELGQLVNKKLHSTSSTATDNKQSVDYRYNIRGWLQSMNNSQLTNDGGVTNNDNNDLFGMELAYNTTFNTGTSTGNSVQFNGNISAMKWSQNQAMGTSKDAAYNYTYDAMNRLTGASYLTNSTTGWGNFSGQFNESGYSYDANGNILSLTRKDATGATMDMLTYNYGTGDSRSNRLLAVGDVGTKTKGFIDGPNSGNDYGYDNNGNMTSDNNKSLDSIKYNYLNLPMRVKKHTGEVMKYTYDASGRKLMQQVYNASNILTKTTEYDGEFIYQGDTLQFINHEEGRIVMKGVSTPEYQYHLKDHLGNVRVTFTTQVTPQQFTAHFENTSESSNFLNYKTALVNNTAPAPNPNATTGTGAYLLNGGYATQVGIAKSFAVMPGDQLQVQAAAKYNATNAPANLTGFAAALLIAFNLPTPAPGEFGTPSATLNNWGGLAAGGFGDGNVDNTDPKIFTTLIIFDKNFNLVDVAFQQLTSSGVMNVNYTIKQPGYAYMYVSNEQPVLTDVYFDDISVTFTPSPVVQMEDFYPFGLSFNSYSRENIVPQNYLFGGKELQKDLSLNWGDFGARMYDPAIARWMVVDPLSEKSRRWSPYTYCYDNPLRFVDLDGMFGDYYTNAGKYLGNDGVKDDKVYTATSATTTTAKGADGKETSTTTFKDSKEIGKKSDFVDMNGKTISSDKTKQNLVGLAINLRNVGGIEGAKIKVEGGDRSSSKNKAVGGSSTSPHMAGTAADISVSGMTNKDLANAAANSGLFTGVIYYPDMGATGGFGTHKENITTLDGCDATTTEMTVTNYQNLPPHAHVDNRPGTGVTKLQYTGDTSSDKTTQTGTYGPWN